MSPADLTLISIVSPTTKYLIKFSDTFTFIVRFAKLEILIAGPPPNTFPEFTFTAVIVPLIGAVTVKSPSAILASERLPFAVSTAT